jgi:hypothetical protein
MEAFTNFQMRAMATRSGYGSINQSFNNNAQIVQGCVNSRSSYWDANMNRVSISTVQQVNDRAFFKRGNRWVDSSLLDKADAKPKRESSGRLGDFVNSPIVSRRKAVRAVSP